MHVYTHMQELTLILLSVHREDTGIQNILTYQADSFRNDPMR